MSKSPPPNLEPSTFVPFLLFNFSFLLSSNLRQCLLEITMIDVLRRLWQRLFKNTLLGGNFDQCPYALDVQISVAIPDAVFPVIVRCIAAVFDADRHFLRQIATGGLAIVDHPAHRRSHR